MAVHHGGKVGRKVDHCRKLLIYFKLYQTFMMDF